MDIYSIADARRVCEGIRYKDGWALHVAPGVGYMTVVIWWSFCAPDYTEADRKLGSWESRPWALSTVGLTEDKLVKTALAAALQAEEHECREAFTYKGVRLFDPHLSVQTLMEAACRST